MVDEVLNSSEETALPQHLALGRIELSVDRARGSHVGCAIIVVTHNGGRDVLPLPGSPATAADRLTTRVIVVDNVPPDNTVQMVKDRHPSDICVEADGILGMRQGLVTVQTGAVVGNEAIRESR